MTEDETVDWFVLVDPRTNTWQQVTEQQARRYPVVEGRLRYALTATLLDDDAAP